MSSLQREVLDEFNQRLPGLDFQAEWLMVVTWSDATPYYWRQNSNEVCLLSLKFSISKTSDIKGTLKEDKPLCKGNPLYMHANL